MIITEYSDLAQSFTTLTTEDEIMKSVIKNTLDILLVAAYIVGLVGVMPVVVAYLWAKENILAQA